MSSAIPGHDMSTPGSGPRSAPVAHISRAVLTANARAARARGIHSFSPQIFAEDAWGHGAGLVRAVLVAEGLTAGDHGDGPTLSAPELLGVAHPTAAPALRLTGTVLSVKDLRAGEGVSYGFAFRAPADTRVALVTGGYAQGIVRGLGGAVDVAIAGERHPIVGRVAMDVCVVEIRDAVVGRGDEVLFLGDPAKGEPALADWVRATGMLAGELITPVGLRSIREEAP
ncbi:alanine racemase C-terminal domain-containing protein [Microbacterium sp. NPDC058389]|uniref:alanine racemase C-terminal domain-containing protein n=1 Tax=Microbacterium sp. NPDC058389 TaxID=3346475 RepID=UPI0036461C2A